MQTPLPHKNHKGSALIIALVVMTLMTMMSTVFFEKVYRFSQRSEGIENSNRAYYHAIGIIETSLQADDVDKYTPWNVTNTDPIGYTTTGASLEAFTGGVTIPVEGKGNSPYDISKSYNIISLGEPVQIVIPDTINWNSINFHFRVPVLPGSTSTSTGVDSSASLTGFILWTIASTGASLFASGETQIFKGSDINNPNATIGIWTGTTNSGSIRSFNDFYTEPDFLGSAGAKCADYKCTLKLSLIRPVPLSDGRSITFLEYQINGFATQSIRIPSQYMTLEAKGYAYGFLRSRTVQFPQITTNTALDFAVLQ